LGPHRILPSCYQQLGNALDRRARKRFEKRFCLQRRGSPQTKKKKIGSDLNQTREMKGENQNPGWAWVGRASEGGAKPQRNNKGLLSKRTEGGGGKKMTRDWRWCCCNHMIYKWKSPAQRLKIQKTSRRVGRGSKKRR